MKNVTLLDNLAQELESMLSEHDQKWVKRKRKLNSKLVFCFLLQMVGCAANQGRESALFFFKYITGESIIGVDVAASSLFAARQKIGWTIFRHLLHKVVGSFEQYFDKKYLWQGHRIFAIDGSKINVPAPIKKIKYRKYFPKAHYPTALVSVLFRLDALIPYHFIFSRHFNELLNVKHLLRKLKPEDIVVYDRLYLCLKTLKEHCDLKIHGVFRLKSSHTLKELVSFAESGEKEQDIVLTRKEIDPVRLRLIFYRIGEKKYYLATTLLDRKKYPTKAIKALYHGRWNIEEQFKAMKRSLNLKIFHSHTTTGLKQEIGIFFYLRLGSTCKFSFK